MHDEPRIDVTFSVLCIACMAAGFVAGAIVVRSIIEWVK